MAGLNRSVRLEDGTVTEESGSTPSPTNGQNETIEFPLGLVSADSATAIPLGALVVNATLKVTAPYTGGTTINIGTVAAPQLLQSSVDNNPTVVADYAAPQTLNWPVGALVHATVGGAPALGAAIVVVEYVPTPNP